MPRVEPLPLEELDEIREELDALREANGYVANSFLIMGRRPEIAKNVLALIRSVMRNPNSTIGPDLRWMVAHVCSRANGCRYCTAHTLKNGAHYGLPQEKVEAVWEYEHNPLFSSAERAALNVALAGGHSPAIVTDADMAELRKHFTDEQVVEIVLVISLFGFNNRWNTIMGTELEPVVTEFQERNKKAFAAE